MCIVIAHKKELTEGYRQSSSGRGKLSGQNFHLQHKHKLGQVRGWRDGSAATSTCCSFLQRTWVWCPTAMWQLTITCVSNLYLKDLTPPSVLCMAHTWLHIHIPKHSHARTDLLKMINLYIGVQVKVQRLELGCNMLKPASCL